MLVRAAGHRVFLLSFDYFSNFRASFSLTPVRLQRFNTENCKNSKGQPPINFFDEILKHSSKVSQLVNVESQNQPEKLRSNIDKETLLLLERLSLVNVEDKEALQTLEDAIEFAGRILDIDTEGVEPMYTVLEEENLYLREDKATQRNTQEDILSNAALTEETYFVAPPGNIPLNQEEGRIEALSDKTTKN